MSWPARSGCSNGMIISAAELCGPRPLTPERVKAALAGRAETRAG